MGISQLTERTRTPGTLGISSPPDLVRQLLEARDTRELTRLQQRLLRVDVLIVDELGFVPFDRAGGELLFNLITDRYERRATVVTSNLACGTLVRAQLPPMPTRCSAASYMYVRSPSTVPESLYTTELSCDAASYPYSVTMPFGRQRRAVICRVVRE